jgi:hypothetical protein
LEDITAKILLPAQEFKDMDLTDDIQLTEAFQGLLASVDGLAAMAIAAKRLSGSDTASQNRIFGNRLVV